MERAGILSPSTASEARATYEDLAPAARTTVRETAKAMDFGREEFDDRVTGDVVATAHDALFASLLSVAIGTREEFDDWRADADHEVAVIGSENVPNVVWHAPPFAGRAVAATYAAEQAAAIATLRRQAFGRIYGDVLETEDVLEAEDVTGDEDVTGGG